MEINDVKLNDIRDFPYQFICNYVESLYPHIGKKTFEILSLMPCSLILPDLPYGSKNVRSNINALFLGSSGSGKSSIAKLFSNFVINALEFESITSTGLESAIVQNPVFSLIVGDFARMSRDPILIKVIEGILGEEKCIFEESLIYTSKGEIKKIRDLSIGEELLSFDNELNLVKTKIISKIKKTFNKYLIIRTRTSSLIVSPEHKFFILNGKYFDEVESKNLKLGEFIPIPLKLPPIKNKLRVEDLSDYETVGITNVSKKKMIERIKELKLTKYGISRELGFKEPSWFSGLINSNRNHKQPKNRIYKLCNILNMQEFFEDESYFPRSIKLPKYYNDEFCEFLGMYWGDGSFNEKEGIMYISEKNKDNIDYYRKLSDKLFGNNTFLRKQGNTYQLFLTNTSPLFKIMQSIGLKKTKERGLPIVISILDNKELSAFIRGYFDAESSVRVSKSGIVINLECSSEEAIKKLRILFLRFGILSSISERKRYDERFKEKNYFSYTLRISDRDSLKKYNKFIGYNHPEKKKRLEEGIRRFKNGHRKYYRYKPEIIKQIMNVLNISINDVFKKTNIRLNEALNGEYNIPLNTLKKLYIFFNSKYSNNPKAREYLDFLNLIISKSDEFSFDEIIDIKEVEGEEKVFYDINLDKNLNFIANGLFTHNSIKRRTARKDVDMDVNGIALLCGVSTDLSKYIISGMIWRLVPILVGHSPDEHSEIGKHIRDKIGNTERDGKEQEIKNYYDELVKIQSKPETRVIGFDIPLEFKNGLYVEWEKLTKPYVKELGLNFFRELMDGYRFLVCHCFLNYYNRKVEKGIIFPIEEDYKVALKLMRQSIKFKFRLIRSESFAKGLKDAKDFKKIMESDKIPEQIKDILRGLVEVKGDKVALRN